MYHFVCCFYIFAREGGGGGEGKGNSSLFFLLYSLLFALVRLMLTREDCVIMHLKYEVQLETTVERLVSTHSTS